MTKEKREHRFILSLSDAENQKLEFMAETLGMSKADCVRLILNKFVQEMVAEGMRLSTVTDPFTGKTATHVPGMGSMEALVIDNEIHYETSEVAKMLGISEEELQATYEMLIRTGQIQA